MVQQKFQLLAQVYLGHTALNTLAADRHKWERSNCHAGEVFQLIEDIVETNNTEDVKACFTFMASYWAELHDTHAMAVLLRFQRACNMFTRKVSNDQDAEILGAVSTEVAKMLPFNSKAGLNMLFMVNKHATPMDKDIGVSVFLQQPLLLVLLLERSWSA